MTGETIDHSARSDLQAHTDICTERYGNLWSAISDLKETIRTNNIVAHERFNSLSNRMWAALATVCFTAVGGLAATVFYLLTHK